MNDTPLSALPHTPVPKPVRAPKVRKPLAPSTKPIARTAAPPRATKPLPRVSAKRLAKVGKKLGRSTVLPRRGPPKRFAHLRSLEYREHIRGLPCILAGHPSHECAGPIDCCHVTSRAAGGADRQNCYPGCRKLHQVQHSIGIESFQALYGLDLTARALAYDRRYVAEMAAQQEGFR